VSSDVYEEKTEDFCEVPGLTVQLEETTETLRKLSVHPGGLPYQMWHHTTTDGYTNLETGKSATELISSNEKTVSVKDNGDGTLTFIRFKVYNAETYGEDGSLIGQRDGHFKVTQRVYHQGTLSNPDDDVELGRAQVSEAVENGEAVDELGPVAGSHFCTVMVEKIG
jgi:hypothetical protein